MVLVEECRLRLDEPVDRWLPELAGRRVLKRIDAELDDTVPARRSITLRDLLTQRLGIGSVMAPAGTYPIQRAMAELCIGGDAPPKPALTPPTDEWIRRLGSLPLLHHPGGPVVLPHRHGRRRRAGGARERLDTPQPPTVRSDLWTTVYQAIAD
jgi:CubicO group peptidase (beta-lactamase class C family)